MTVPPRRIFSPKKSLSAKRSTSADSAELLYTFNQGVKLITGEGRLERARRWYQRFLRSTFDGANIPDHEKDEKAKSKMAGYEKYGFPYWKVELLEPGEFAKWKAEEKSRKAKLSRAKRGRVRSKSDKRLGARPPG
jgi:hypothetical protein